MHTVHTCTCVRMRACVYVNEHVCGEGCMCTCVGELWVCMCIGVMHIHDYYADIHVQYAHTYSVYVCV